MNQSRSSRTAPILAFGLFAFFIAVGQALAAPVTRVDPPVNAVIKFSNGNRTFSFTDPAVWDGGNPAGTIFTVYMDERPRNIGTALDASDQRVSFTKSTDDEETFSFDTGAFQFDLPMSRFVISRTGFPASPYTGLHLNTQYLWRIDVNGATGSNMRFYTDVCNPGNGSVDVSLYCRFTWEAPQSWMINDTIGYEQMFLFDMDDMTPSYIKDFPFCEWDGDPQKLVLLEDRMTKEYDYHTPRNDGRNDVREYWIYDSGYPGRYLGTEARLMPGNRYAWRILYKNWDGAPMYWEMSGDTEKQDGLENWVWADGGDDFGLGWTFTTISEFHVMKYGARYVLGDTPPFVDPEVESLIVFWQSPYGSRAKDPVEGRWTFADDAATLKDIHENVHGPSIKTDTISTEMVVAGYGGMHHDHERFAGRHPQQPLVGPITQWPGWYTIDRDPKAEDYYFYADIEEWPDGWYEASAQDQYEEWIARGIRTFLQDATNGFPNFSGGNPGGFLYDNDQTSMPNLQYVILLGDADRVAPSFYYLHENGLPSMACWVSSEFFYMTQTADSEALIDPRYQVSRIPMRRASLYDEQPVITKIRDYAELLNTEQKKENAFRDWFGRVVMVSGSRHWFQWYQMFPGFAQYLLGQKTDVGGGQRDAFTGMRVRKYDILSPGAEALTVANVMRHLVNSDPDDVPGIVYLLCQGFSVGASYDHAGQWVNLTPSDFPETMASATFLKETMFPETFEGSVDGRRPLLVNLASCASSVDNDLWINSVLSFNQAAVLAEGGPIAAIGFVSGYYEYPSDTWTRELKSGTQTMSFGTHIDLSEGQQYLKLDKGVLELEKDDSADLAVVGKMELVKLLVQKYGSTTQAGIGNIFNKALQDYVTTHSTEFLANDYRVAPNIFGFSILGDCALVMPHIEPSTKDNVRPVVTDTNPRPATVVAGYPETPRYNSQDMPIHTIPRSDPYDPNLGAPITVRIATDAPFVRVRVMTPFLRNSSFVPGGWFSATEVTENSTQVYATTNGSYTYTFNAKTPSVYFLVIQAQNPAWVSGVDDPEWRWLQERWLYVQAVNQFVRDPLSNILVIDMDQTNRYHLGRYQDVEYNEMGGFEQDTEDYLINPGLDGLGYLDGIEDPRNFPFKPALPLLNSESGLSPAYKSMYWSGNAYENNAINADIIKSTQKYYGEITPSALKSFQDSRGVVTWFGGDFARPSPDGYLVLFASVEEDEAGLLKSFAQNGGRLFMSNQSLLDQSYSITGAYNDTPFAVDFLQNALSVTGRVLDVDLTNMDGLRRGTFGELIRDVNAAGGDGADNAIATGEIDPNGVEALSVFTWDLTSGPAGPTPPEGTASTAVQSRLAGSGGRTVFITWPFEAIDHPGDLGVDNSGRENVMKQVVDWLRAVPEAIAPDPADGAIGVSLSKTLSWSRVPEAEHYRLYIGTNQATFTNGPGITVDRDNPSYKPLSNLAQNTRYFWRVDTKNVDDYTIGDVWTFNTVAPAPQATSPVPTNGATQVPLDQLLSWAQDNQVDTYDITIWEDAVGGSNVFDTESFLTVAEHLPSPRLNPNKTYFWRVNSRNELGVITGPIWSFSTITPPPVPTVPDPADTAPNNSAIGANNVPTNKVFGWNVTLRTDRYDVFVWKAVDTAPAVDAVAATFSQWSGSSLSNSYSPGELDRNTTYNWQVRPVNEAGRQNTVDTWSFTTSSLVAAPSAPLNPTPANGAAGIATSPTLSWSKAAGANRYDVFFWVQGTTPPTTPEVTNLNVASIAAPRAPLTIGTTYSWRVIAKNSEGIEMSSAPWSFTVGAAKPANIFPANLAMAVIPSVTFQWDDSAGADHYNFYLAQGTILPATPTATPTASQFKPATDLLTMSSYIWRVDAVSPSGDVTMGDVATFTTGTSTGVPDMVTGLNPADGAVNVKVNTLLRWNPAAGAASYTVYFGPMVLPVTPTATGLTVTQYNPGPLNYLATYRWRVDAVGPDGVTVTPGIESSFTTAAQGGTPPGGGGGGASCFIATSAYESISGLSGLTEFNCTGSYMLAPERVDQLNDIRGIRDELLLNISAGQDFSAWYYAVGPYAADAIRNCEPAKAAVRAAVLNPLSALSRASREREQ